MLVLTDSRLCFIRTHNKKTFVAKILYRYEISSYSSTTHMGSGTLDLSTSRGEFHFTGEASALKQIADQLTDQRKADSSDPTRKRVDQSTNPTPITATGMNLNSFRGYDLTIVNESILGVAVAAPESSFSGLLLVCTASSLLELRKSWGKTRIEKAHDRAFFTDVSLKRSFGVWNLEISTYSGGLKYTGERDQLERIAQFLRQWEHEADTRTESLNNSTEHSASESNWRYARAAPKDDVRKSTVWSQWLKGCSLIVLGLIVLLVGIGIFSDCSDDSPSTGVSDTQQATREARLNINATAVKRSREAVEKSREAQTATATTSSLTRDGLIYTPTPPAKPSPTPTFEQLKSEAVEIDYDDLVNPTKWHIGKRIRFMAKIIQVIPEPELGENLFVLRANVTRSAHSWDDEVLLEYTGPRLFENDIFEMVGTVVRLLTYEAVSGNEVTVPHILVVASQRVEEVDRVVITQTPIVGVETVEVEKEVVVVVTATPTSTQIPTQSPSPTQGARNTPTPTATSSPIPTPGTTETPTPTATPSPTPEPPSTPAELVERVRDSVVRVKARSGGALFGATSQGSGFIFAVEGTTAFVATNHHVIDGSNSVEVQIGDASTYDGLVLGWDAERDVAVVSICCSSDFIALPWGDASPTEGETVIAIGYPDSGTGDLIATIGEVGAADDLSIEYDFVPHSAPLNPGNSGGPLISMPAGEVVGINTSRGTETLAFYAVPYQAIEDEVEEWRSQLVIVPEPTPAPVVPFATIEGENFAYTVNEIRDPVQPRFGIKTGNRLVAIDVSLVALVDGAYYNPGRFALQDEDGYIWDDWTWPDIDPGLSDGHPSTGQRARGWIAFEVPQSSVITSVLVEDSRRTVIIADLTRD